MPEARCLCSTVGRIRWRSEFDLHSCSWRRALARHLRLLRVLSRLSVVVVAHRRRRCRHIGFPPSLGLDESIAAEPCHPAAGSAVLLACAPRASLAASCVPPHAQAEIHRRYRRRSALTRSSPRSRHAPVLAHARPICSNLPALARLAVRVPSRTCHSRRSVPIRTPRSMTLPLLSAAVSRRARWRLLRTTFVALVSGCRQSPREASLEREYYHPEGGVQPRLGRISRGPATGRLAHLLGGPYCAVVRLIGDLPLVAALVTASP